MNADEILTEYEAIWMGFALTGRPQFYGVAGGGLPVYVLAVGQTCAFVARAGQDEALQRKASAIIADWRCPECPWISYGLSGAMIHINNAHHRDFLWFATKFRAAWFEGLKR
jgi:hypothetical protein